MKLLLAPLLVALACSGGTSGGAFAPTFPDNRDRDLAPVLSQLEAQPPPGAGDRRGLAVGLTSAPHFLYAVDLTTGALLWKEGVGAPVSAPHIAGDLVVLHEAEGVVARDGRTGARRFAIEDEALHLAGAGGEGGLSVLALTTGAGVSARSKLVLARDGRIAWERRVAHSLGAPTVAAGMLFVPWATQNLSVLDTDGSEIARVRITDTTVARTFREAGGLYFGQHGVFRLTASIASGRSSDAAYFEPAGLPLPGDAEFMVDPYKPAPGPASALHRLRFAWQPVGEGESVTLQDGLLYAIFYRLVFALDANANTVRWVHELEEDVVGAGVTEGGLFLADMGGGMTFLQAEDGRPRWNAAVDATPTVVAFRSGSAPQGSPEQPAQSLRDQLLAAARSTDARLVPARVLAVRMLHALQDDDVTARMIMLCDDPRTAPRVREEACGLLALRSTGGEHVIAALRRHTRFLEGTEAGPVASLARASVTIGLPSAVPELVAHLRDPETPAEALSPILTALAHFADRSTIEPIRNFLRLYHAEAIGEPMVEAMGAAADALFALEGPAAEETLIEVSEDPLAPGPVRQRVQASLNALRASVAEADDGSTASPEAPEEEDPEEETEAQPDHITAPMVIDSLGTKMDQLRLCVRQDEEGARSARVVLAVDGEGALQMAHVSPLRLQRCIETLLRDHTYPANSRGARQQVILNIRSR